MKILINFILAIALMCIVLFAVITVLIFPPLLIVYTFIYGVYYNIKKLNSEEKWIVSIFGDYYVNYEKYSNNYIISI